MITELLSRRREAGIGRISLNFCMFRYVFEASARVGSSVLTRVNSSVLGVLDRFWQLERLYRNNRQYQPDWVPRYLCYEGVMALPQVAVAVGIAEGFLPRFTRAERSPRRLLTCEELAAVHQVNIEPAPAPDSAARSRSTTLRLQHLQEVQANGDGGYPAADSEAPQSVAALGVRPWRNGQDVLVRGRLRAVRDHKGVVFADLAEEGSVVQLLLEADHLGVQALRRFVRLCDSGDYLIVTGRTGRSRRGTPAVIVDAWSTAAKCLHPLPPTGWADVEDRARRRSADLVVHPEQLRYLKTRAKVTRSLRAVLEAEEFCEVETPILQPVHGGASARPFRTSINAYGVDLFLRIAPETYLKRLVVGGMGRIYEIGRNFRNEGVDPTHNPEFTSLEAYQPFADYETMRELTRKLICAAAMAANGAPLLHVGSRPIDICEPWRVVPVLEALSCAVGQPISADTGKEQLAALADHHGIAVPPDWGPGAIIEELYGELVEPNTHHPTFFLDFPIETSPLARPHRSIPGLAERWDLVIGGMEVATAYTELTDPLDQRERFTQQSLKAAYGDPEAMEIDEDFLTALEFGMPPCGGLGLGVDRLVMLIIGQPIRSTLAFPFVKPAPISRSGVCAAVS